MKFKYSYIPLFLMLWLLASCNNNNTTEYVPSDDPTVASLTFAANDSFPSLAKAVFTIEERIDTGLIYNVDSLDYGTRIDSVRPTFTFNGSVVSAAIIYTATDTISLSGSDTINFSVQPVYLQSISENGLAEKWYKIYVNVHQSDPDLYVWEQIADNVADAAYTNQHTVMLNDVFYMFISDGLHSKVLQSTDGVVWNATTAPFENFQVDNVIIHNDKIYCLNNAQIAILNTEKGTWEVSPLDGGLQFNVEQLVFSFNDSIWAVVTDKTSGTVGLATSADASKWVHHEVLSSDFPVSDFAALSFSSKTGRKRAMIVGGFSSEGESLNTRWNVEFDPTKGYKWENFSIEQPSFGALTGVSIIYYDQRFFMFGGVDADNTIGEYNILESYDEGMNWAVPDSTHNALPESYKPRAHQSVVIDSKNNIYIIGGKSRTEVFTDVYRGRLNSINW